MIKFIAIVLALVLPATVAGAQYNNRTYYGPNGSPVGSSTQSSSGQTTFYGSNGAVAGRAVTDSQRTTTFYDAQGRVSGRVSDPSFRSGH
jgi:YD repeat-containing protein